MRRAVFTWAAVLAALLAVELRGDLPDWAIDKPDIPPSKLAKKIDVDFDDPTFEKAVEYLRDVTGANLVVNWRSLDGAGIRPDKKVGKLKLTGVSASHVLDIVLERVGGDLVPLGYDLCEGGEVITISTFEDLGKWTHIRSYDVGPLMFQARDKWAPRMDREDDEELIVSDGLPRHDRLQQIMDEVRDTVDPDNWRSAGGLVSSMSEIDEMLVIRTTCWNHYKIATLLRLMYENRPKQVSVQAYAVAMSTATAQSLIDKEAGGKLIVDPETAAVLAGKFIEPGDHRKLLGGGRFVVFDEQRGFVSDRSVRTRMPAPPDAKIDHRVDVHSGLKSTENLESDVFEKDETEQSKVKVESSPDGQNLTVHVQAPSAPTASLARANLPLSGLVVEVEPTIGIGAEEVMLNVWVDFATPTSDGGVDKDTGVPDYVERRLRPTVRIPNGGAAILSMPDAERGGEIVVLIRAQVIE